LETKEKMQNISQVVGKVCCNWQWVHNATMTERGRIIVCWHLKRYKYKVIEKSDQMMHGKVIQLSTNKRFFITFMYGRNLYE